MTQDFYGALNGRLDTLMDGPLNRVFTTLTGMTIAELVSAPTIILMDGLSDEEKALLIPFYTKSGRRLFSQTDIVRLKCIRNHLDEQGLNIAGIKALMAMVPCWLLKPCSESDRL